MTAPGVSEEDPLTGEIIGAVPRWFVFRRAAGYGVNILLAIASAIGTVLLLELGARLSGPTTPFFLAANRGNCLQRTPLLSLEFRPNCTGTLSDTAFRTNSIGLRGPELRDDGSTRILALGDSSTWGWHVAEEKSYPAVLQGLLDREAPGRHQVINAGVPGYTSYQGLVYLRERGLALRPGVVIIAFGFNDGTREGGDVEEQITRERMLLPLIRLDDFLLQQSSLYRWARWRGARAATGDRAMRVPAQRYRRNLADMVRMSREHGANVLLLSFLHPLGLARDHVDALMSVAEELGVPLLWYDDARIDHVHPSAKGYRNLAAEVLKQLTLWDYLQ